MVFRQSATKGWISYFSPGDGWRVGGGDGVLRFVVCDMRTRGSTGFLLATSTQKVDKKFAQDKNHVNLYIMLSGHTVEPT